jgi:signal transduction histidine kinase
VDIAMFTVAVLFGLWIAAERLDSGPAVDPSWLFQVDQLTGVVSCLALWLRRRWPMGLAIVLVLASTYSELASGAMLLALFSVAVHRGPRRAAAVFGLSVVAASVYVWLRPDSDWTWQMAMLLGLALQGGATGWGLFIHHRRRLLDSLRDRAQRAEAAARLRVEQAQRHARDEIAREIHDVLGHRLSLLSVHAGALEYRPDAPAAEIVRAAHIIRESSHQALQDLRQVIGVLRAPVGELPQPTLDDVDRLVEESRRAGMDVTVEHDHAGDPGEPAGRTAYRVVQEALTNIRKHAPGAAVQVQVAGRAGDRLTVTVVNTAAAQPGLVSEDAGSGLTGLAERAELAGGGLEYGPGTGGGWRLSAWLPWPP